MKFSEDIEQLLSERFGEVKLEEMSLEELIAFREEVQEIRDEFFMLEMAVKTLMNAAYGASANQYFYFFNVKLAADITGECRLLTKTMWKNLEEWFKEGIWKRKDLWEKFEFELDESKHDWYRQQKVSIYSDTDSLAGDSKLLLRYKGNIFTKTFDELWNDVTSTRAPFSKRVGGQQFCESDYDILNWTKERGLHFVPINYVMKHKTTKAKFKIKTKSGKEITVTGDHSCIVFRNGKQIAIKAKDINIKTDKILSVKKK